MKLSRGVLGLPLLMLAFAITITKRAERGPISLLRKPQLLERGGDLQEAARAYDSLVSQYPAELKNDILMRLNQKKLHF